MGYGICLCTLSRVCVSGRCVLWCYISPVPPHRSIYNRHHDNHYGRLSQLERHFYSSMTMHPNFIALPFIVLYINYFICTSSRVYCLKSSHCIFQHLTIQSIQDSGPCGPGLKTTAPKGMKVQSLTTGTAVRGGVLTATPLGPKFHMVGGHQG